jgi:hypothetical protein
MYGAFTVSGKGTVNPGFVFFLPKTDMLIYLLGFVFKSSNKRLSLLAVAERLLYSLVSLSNKPAVPDVLFSLPMVFLRSPIVVFKTVKVF